MKILQPSLPLLDESRSEVFEESPVNQGFFHISICQTSAYPYNIPKAEVNHTAMNTQAWNKNKSLGQKPPLTYEQVQAIKTTLVQAGTARDRALFSLAIDSSLRSTGWHETKRSSRSSRFSCSNFQRM